MVENLYVDRQVFQEIRSIYVKMNFCLQEGFLYCNAILIKSTMIEVSI